VADLSSYEPGTFRRFNNRLVFLIGQSVSLGILLALLIVTASALFLTEFGSQALPYVYIAVAILGAIVFYGFAEIQRRWKLPALSILTLSLTALFFLLSWIGLTFTDATWISFLLMISFSLLIQMGFIILGGQAGRLFDVRQMKLLFPRVVAGFAIGFMVGGFMAAILAGFVGQIANLLLFGIVAALSMLGFLIVTDRRYHSELVQAGTKQSKTTSKPLWQLLAKRFVLVIVLYQMLSAMASQLLDFMMLDQAAARFTDSQSLATFMGNYRLALNLVDILFLSLFAGLLFVRFGLKFGLAANPVVDGIILILEIIVVFAFGASSGLFFWLVMSAFIVDITLTDGTTRGSINTAYQALPASDRVTVQTGVEGIGVPIAHGLIGILLLVFSAIDGLSIIHIIYFTLFITVLWAIFGFSTYRHYATSLMQAIRRRALDSAEISLDDSSSLGLVERLFESENLLEVRLALDMLEDAAVETLDNDLIKLVGNSSETIQAEVLSRIEKRKIQAALPGVRHCLVSAANPTTVASSLRALCALEETEVVDEILPYMDDTDPEVRLGATVGLLKYGGIPGILAAANRLSPLESSDDPTDRLFLAKVIGEVEVKNFYQPLLSLLADPDIEVRQAAVLSAGKIQHPKAIPSIINNLDNVSTRSAAMSALVSYDQVILPFVQQSLEGEGGYSPQITEMLVRASGQIKSDEARELLIQYVTHPDNDVRYHVLVALSQTGYQAEGNERIRVEEQLKVELKNGANILAARQDIVEDESTVPVRRALLDELDRLRQRVYFLLSFLYDSASLIRASEQLEARTASERALALETLEVMLSGSHKSLVFPFIDPKLSDTQQREKLSKIFGIPSYESDERLIEILANRNSKWQRPWIRACAAYALGKMGINKAVDVVELALETTDVSLRETAAWALFELAPDRYRSHEYKLRNDPALQINRLAVALSKRSK
jgi:HEAT repeat protein